jgi:hypothetical protein
MSDHFQEQPLTSLQVSQKIGHFIGSANIRAITQAGVNSLAARFATPIEVRYEFAASSDLHKPGNDNVVEAALNDLWQGILAAVTEVDPTNTIRLSLVCRLLGSLQRRANPRVTDQDLCLMLEKASLLPWSIDDGKMWSGLCMFGWVTREKVDGLYSMIFGINAEGDQRDRWLSLQHFLAKVTAENTSDETFLGLSVIREVFEDENFGGRPSEVGRETLVLTAALWLVECGERWWKHGWKIRHAARPSGQEQTSNVLGWENNKPFEIDRNRMAFWYDKIWYIRSGCQGQVCRERMADAATLLQGLVERARTPA